MSHRQKLPEHSAVHSKTSMSLPDGRGELEIWKKGSSPWRE